MSSSSVAARQLWESPDPFLWRDALQGYSAVIFTQGAAGLVELDVWYREQLPRLIAGRTPAYLERAELLEVVRWKMKRGEWRARNLALAQGNSDTEVRERTARAFAQTPDPRRPLEEVGSLAGVGPATASAMLAAARPDLYPFLDDLVGGALMQELGEPKFTLPYYLRYAAALRARAAELGADWDAQRVGLALWSASGGKAARP